MAGLFLKISLLSLVAFLSINLACDTDPQVDEPPQSEPSEDPEPHRLAEGFEDVDCPGDNSDDALERALFGEVLGPDTRRADAAVGPLPGIEVSLQFLSQPGKEENLLAETTTTDEAGRWCLIAPADIDWSMATTLVADTTEETLRRPPLSPGRIDIDAPSEALLRILSEEGIVLTGLQPATYQALHDELYLALERVPEVRPRAGGGLTSYMARLQETLRADQEFLAAVETVYLETVAE